MPASLAAFTHSSALNKTGLNSLYKLSYSVAGTCSPRLQPISVPRRVTGPQWINIPKRLSMNSFTDFSGVLITDCAFTKQPENIRTITGSVFLNPTIIYSLWELRLLLVPERYFTHVAII